MRRNVRLWAAWDADLNRASRIMLRDESLRAVLFLSLAVATAGAGCTSCKQKEVAGRRADDAPALGRFIWHELMTSDPAAAASFYSDVMGWTAHRDDADYTTLRNGNASIGGIPKLQTWKEGDRPYWTGTVLVDDVDRTAQLARDIGGIVSVEPVDVPNARFAIIEDFRGGSMHVSRPVARVRLHDSRQPGEFYWCEYEATDGNAALGFYGLLFGWVSLDERAGSPAGELTVFGRNGIPIGSIHADQGLPNRWLYFIQVTDLDASIKRALAKGGSIRAQPSSVSDGRVAVLYDPQGAVFALHQSAGALPGSGDER